MSFFSLFYNETFESVTDNEIHLKKNLINNFDQAIGVLGPPGSGKSSLCCAYYKFIYELENQYFENSTNGLSFRKGIWRLKESERKKTRKNIAKDILMVEGFQVDDIKSWKYIMIISFICSEVIILNRNTRLDDTKKVLNIIKNSLSKMKESNIPKILKTIYIQVDDEDEIPDFENKLSEIGYKTNSIEGITIKYFYIPTFDKKTMKKHGCNILNVEDYKEAVIQSFSSLLPLKSKNQSISTFIKYIDNLNNALDGKMNFDEQIIIKDLQDDYETCYKSWENKKKNELLKLDLSDVNDLNETFDQYIDRQDLDFSFVENLEELTFYGSSDKFDNYYKKFGRNKNFTVDKEIFRDLYNTKINMKEIEINRKGTQKQKILSEIEEEFVKQKREIDKYFGSLKFYGDIDNKNSRCKMNIYVSSEFTNVKNKYLEDLYNYYENKEKKKKQDWKDQINRSKYKHVCQTYGENKCSNGHTLNDGPITCGTCTGNGKKGVCYWVDGPEKYAICDGCNKVRTIKNVVCGKCDAPCKFEVKYCDYIPG